ncbi:MFS family permease [Bradyrhizobium sp. i1.4.4]
MSGPNASLMVPGLRRNMVTICAMTATIMQALDTTIANVALPYMQGSLSASQDQINWVLTSYIVAAAIMTAPVGWIANRFGRKRIFIICAAGFTFASVLCGLAQDINQMVLFRLLQGVFGAALVPLSQSVMLDYYTLQERAKAMSIWGMGVMMGPDHGPLARRLADRDLFLALGVLRQSAVRRHHRARADRLHGRDQKGHQPQVRLVRLCRAGDRDRLASARA